MGLLLHESDEQLQVLERSPTAWRAIRVGMLEWAYREEDFGAPLEHRLSPDALMDLAIEAGFSKCEVIPLTKLDFLPVDRLIRYISGKSIIKSIEVAPGT